MADSRRYVRSRPSRVTPYGPSKVSHRRSIQYDLPAYGPSKVPPRRSTQYDPPAIGPSKVSPGLRPVIRPSEVPHRSSSIPPSPRPAIDPKFSPLLRPAMDLSKVPPCLHYLYPYGLHMIPLPPAPRVIPLPSAATALRRMIPPPSAPCSIPLPSAASTIPVIPLPAAPPA